MGKKSNQSTYTKTGTNDVKLATYRHWLSLELARSAHVHTRWTTRPLLLL